MTGVILRTYFIAKIHAADTENKVMKNCNNKHTKGSPYWYCQVAGKTISKCATNQAGSDSKFIDWP